MSYPHKHKHNPTKPTVAVLQTLKFKWFASQSGIFECVFLQEANIAQSHMTNRRIAIKIMRHFSFFIFFKIYITLLKYQLGASLRVGRCPCRSLRWASRLISLWAAKYCIQKNHSHSHRREFSFIQIIPIPVDCRMDRYLIGSFLCNLVEQIAAYASHINAFPLFRIAKSNDPWSVRIRLFVEPGSAYLSLVS